MRQSDRDLPVVVSAGPRRSTLTVPKDHPLAVREGETVALRLGKQLLQPLITCSAALDGEARLTVSRKVPWPRGTSHRLWLRHGRRLWHVGPIVGILSTVYPRVRYGPQDTLFQRMIAEADSMGVLAYVFSVGSVNHRSGRALGYRHDGRAWRPAHYPLPDVVYNRTQTTPAIRRFERGLRKRRGTVVFNGRLGSKWRQYRILARDPETAPYLPATRLLRSGRDLTAIVSRFGGAYVKPSRGGFGKGIWRIERRQTGYDVRRTDGRGRSHRLGRMSLRGAYRAIRRYGRTYIVQQRLHLIRWRGSIADVRILVQKDVHGRWDVTGVGVRVGRGATIVSNLAGGGRAETLDTVLGEVFADRPVVIDEIKALVPQLALRLAARLERAARPLGELGIDFGVDRTGRVWFLEANSRTGRNLFHRIDRHASGRQADRRPMEYALYLAGFRPSEPQPVQVHKLSREWFMPDPASRT